MWLYAEAHMGMHTHAHSDALGNATVWKAVSVSYLLFVKDITVFALLWNKKIKRWRPFNQPDRQNLLLINIAVLKNQAEC
jgi:hypothetical protein